MADVLFTGGTAVMRAVEGAFDSVQSDPEARALARLHVGAEPMQ